jgi:RNA polymerase-binding transcription factor DksA
MISLPAPFHGMSPAMNKREAERFRKPLIELLARLQPEVAEMTRQTLAPSGGQAGGELTNSPMHLADKGTEEFLHGINAVLLRNEEKIVEQARDALARIAEGTFGVCEECGENIPGERLDAMPFVRYCVGCASKIDAGDEGANFNEGRPRTPADTLAPEGEMGESRRKRAGRRDAMDGSGHVEDADIHAAGTAGGGTAIGGLAGTNFGRGEPDVAQLEDAVGSGVSENRDEEDENYTPRSGRSGGAVGGTPARKRAK